MAPDMKFCQKKLTRQRIEKLLPAQPGRRGMSSAVVHSYHLCRVAVIIVPKGTVSQVFRLLLIFLLLFSV
jgi:hypothetical protein